MGFNELLTECGDFGLYQKCMSFCFHAQTMLVIACTYWTQIFILIIPPHRCKLSADDYEWTYLNDSSWSNNYTQCTLPEYNTTEGTVCRYGMLYDFSENFPTFASEHDWVCEDSWKMYLVHSCYLTGCVLSSLAFGVFSDKYGRKRSYQMSVLMVLASDVATFFCQGQVSFMAARFCTAFGVGNLAVVAFVLVIECVGPKRRIVNLFLSGFSFAVFASIFPWLAFYVGHWKYIIMISWIPTAGAIILSLFISESASWLLSTGRINEAVIAVDRIARVNGKKLHKDYIREMLLKKDSNDNCKIDEKDITDMDILKDVKDNNATPKELPLLKTISAVFRSSNLRKKILLFAFIWMTVSSSYNGNNLELSNLPYNACIAYSISNLVEIPGNVFCILTLDRLGRRWTNAGCLLAGGISGIISANMSSPPLILFWVLVMKCCYSASFDITFTFCSESFPTVIRGSAIAIIRTVGGMGMLLSPFIVKLSETEPLLPIIVFGALAVTAGILTMFLEETANQHLPHTLEDSKNIKKKQLGAKEKNLNQNEEKPVAEPKILQTSKECSVTCVGFKYQEKY